MARNLRNPGLQAEIFLKQKNAKRPPTTFGESDAKAVEVAQDVEVVLAVVLASCC